MRTAVAAAIFATTAFSATVVDLGTNNASNWSITGAGASGATALAAGAGLISITDNGLQTGNYITGGSTGAFNGFWYADFMFILPGDAINVVLNFSLAGDDRVVMQLNGTDIGNEAIDGPGIGLMDTGSGDTLYSFTVGANAGNITSFFNIGGGNLLRLIVNNTGSGRTGPTQSYALPTDGTAVGLTGTVSFDQEVLTPEPGSVSLILLGMGTLAWRLRRRRSS